ncbi:MAG: hypothetical protein QNL04_07640 [SAR324 cluster bacterium]|nr:hypothetical protein [SAR324 cluster bacterium]
MGLSKGTTAKNLVQIFELIELKQFNRATLDLKNLVLKDASAIELVQNQLIVATQKDDESSAFYLGEFLTDRGKITAHLANELGKLAGKGTKKNQAKGFFAQALKLDKDHPFAAFNHAAAQNGFLVFDQELLDDIKNNVPTSPLLPDNPYLKGEPEAQTAKEIIAKKLRSLESDRLQRLLFEEDDEEESTAQTTAQTPKAPEVEEPNLENSQHQGYLRDFLIHHQGVLSVAQKLDLRFFLWDDIINLIEQKEYDLAQQEIDLLIAVDHKTLYPELLHALVLVKNGQELNGAMEITNLNKSQPSDLFISLAYNLLVKNEEAQTNEKVKVAAKLKLWGGNHSLQDRINYLKKQTAALGIEKVTEELFLLTDETENLEISIQILDLLTTHSLWEKVMELFENLKEENPNSSLLNLRADDLHLTLFRAAINVEDKGMFRKAIELYHLALRAKEDADCYRQIASCHALLGEVAMQKGAESQMRQVKYSQEMQLKEENLKEMVEQGKSHIRKKEYNKGIEILKNAFAMKKTPELYNLIASIYRKLKWPRTLKHFNEQWQMHYNTPDFDSDPDASTLKS